MRKFSRRTFVSAAPRALAAGAAAAGALAASRPARAAQRRGGSLRIALSRGSTTDTLDPATYQDGFMRTLGRAVFNNLTEVDEDNKLVPELAESWEASEGASKWTFKLRRGVTFHNGKDLTAADVAASVNHHRQGDSGAGQIAGQVADIKADGKHTVVFNLIHGNPDFPVMLSDYHLAVMPEKNGEADALSGVGTGGYQVLAFEPGARFEGLRYAGYWKTGRANFDDVDMRSIQDTDARIKALQAGETDVIDSVPTSRIDALILDENIRVRNTKGSAHYSLPMRTDIPPFNDKDVRMALKYSVDREDLVDRVLNGYGSAGNDHPISENYFFHNFDLPRRVFDPGRAQFHMRKSGSHGLRVPLHTAEAAFDGAVDAAALYKQHAAKAGIFIDVMREPNDGYWEKVWRKKPWCMCYWTGRRTEDWMFSTAYAAEAAWNDTYWRHERFNMLLNEARGELDENKRREMYYEMQKIVSDDGGVVIPMFNDYVFAIRADVKHGQLSSDSDLDGDKCIERWWFA